MSVVWTQIHKQWTKWAHMSRDTDVIARFSPLGNLYFPQEWQPEKSNLRGRVWSTLALSWEYLSSDWADLWTGLNWSDVNKWKDLKTRVQYWSNRVISLRISFGGGGDNSPVPTVTVRFPPSTNPIKQSESWQHLYHYQPLIQMLRMLFGTRWARNAVLIFQQLCCSFSVNPEEIPKMLQWKTNRNFENKHQSDPCTVGQYLHCWYTSRLTLYPQGLNEVIRLHCYK